MTPTRFATINPYLAAFLATGAVTLVALPLRADLDTVEVLIFYLAAVAGVSLLANRNAGIVAALTAFLTFNFFFTLPYYTLFVDSLHDIVALGAFLGLSLLISRLVVRARNRTLDVIRHGQQMETLNRLSFALIRAHDVSDVLRSIVVEVRDVFNLSGCAILLAERDEFHVAATSGDGRRLVEDEALLAASARILARGGPLAGKAARIDAHAAVPRSSHVAPGDGDVLIVPIGTAEQRIGVLLAARSGAAAPLSEEDNRLLTAFVNQAALAIERSLLNEERTRAEILSRTDELRKALLSAVSHDLRTPLTSIKASITTLMQDNAGLGAGERAELMATVDEEADRLNRIVTNLLDVSRIEAGALQPARDWYTPQEIVREALDRLERQLAGREVTVEWPDPPVLVDVDFVMITEVLANLLENAVKYSPFGTPIRIASQAVGDMLHVSVEDRGIGIPEEEAGRIFDTFYRVRSDRRIDSTGIGLAICRGFVEAHGGDIRVERNAYGGSTFIFTLPLAAGDDRIDEFQAAKERHAP